MDPHTHSMRLAYQELTNAFPYSRTGTNLTIRHAARNELVRKYLVPRQPDSGLQHAIQTAPKCSPAGTHLLSRGSNRTRKRVWTDRM